VTTAPTPNNSTRNWWLVAVALVLLVGLAFGRVLTADFLIYDDWEYVVTNDMVRRGLTLESFTWAWQAFHSSNWHPLTWLSHMVDVQLYGLQPAGHHATNLILHTINTVLLLTLLRRLTGSLWRSALVAAWFGLHPTHVESVAWVSERKDVLSTFFGLLCLLAYTRYARSASTLNPQPSTVASPSAFRFLTSGSYWLTFLFLALGLMSKPMLVTWPFVLLLLDIWPLRRLELSTFNFQLSTLKRLVLEKVPFFVLTAASCVVTFFAQRAGGAVQSMEQLTVTTRVANALVSYVRYLGKTFWPTDLSIYYPYPAAWSAVAISGATLLLLALFLLALRFRTERPYGFVGLSWFLGTLVPVIGIVQVGGQSLADRYQYLPQIGIFILLAWGLGELVARRPAARGAVLGGVGLTVLACLGLTWQRTGDWRNSEVLFKQALRVTKDNHIAYNNLGLHYLKEKRYADAIKCFEEALRIRPGFAATHSNLGLCLSALSQNEAAIEQFRAALKFRPTLHEARVNLGNVLVMQGQVPEALELLQEAVAALPRYPEGHLSLANALVEQDRLDEALVYLRQALQLRPDYADALNCWGSLLLRQGKSAEAMERYRAALALNPSLAEAHSNLGLALAGAGQTREAMASYETALTLNPDLLSAHFGLAILKESLGQLEAATAHWAAAVEKSPSLAGAREQMGMLLAKQGKLPEALPHLAEAVRLQPENARLHAQHGLVLDQLGQTAAAVAAYRQAVTLGTTQPEVWNNLSWILATHPSADLRAPAEAVQLGEKACLVTEHREVRFLGTLAAAYAAAERFPEAITTAQRAVDLARTSDQPELAARNEELLNLYRAGQPYREAVPEN
jgi:tetratricopeptide (TPR) repeat protein